MEKGESQTTQTSAEKQRLLLRILRLPKSLRFDNYRDASGRVWRQGKIGWRRIKNK